MVHLKPREYEGPLDTPDDYLFAERMCRFAQALAGSSKKKEKEENDK